MKIIFLIPLIILTHLYSEQISQSDVVKFFSENKVGFSPDYAVVKNGIAGEDYLMVIFGYTNSKEVCESLIKPYNENRLDSVIPGLYSCKKLND